MFFFNVPFDIPEIKVPEVNIPFEISADYNFSSDSANFSAGQTIYVRVTTTNSSPAETHILVLHDSNYITLQTYNLNQSGNSYSTSIQAPGAGGSYSLEVKLVTNGSVNSFVRTIQVGDSGSSSNVTIKQVNNRGNSEVSDSQSKDPSTEPSPSQIPGPGTPDPQVPGNATGNIFASIWLAIFNFWDNFWH